jgi:hypothetical protein
MRLFDRYTSFWLAILYTSLLFLPKINLMNLGEKETAGIRTDDILLLFFFLFIFWARFSLKIRSCAIERSILAFVSLSFISYLLNRIFVSYQWLQVEAHILYSLRIAEYFLFFYIGALLASFFRLSLILKSFLFWNALLMICQKYGWIGQFTVIGYLPTNTDRVTGIASFPSEAGMLLNMLFAYLIYEEKRIQPLKYLPIKLYTFFQQTRLYWLFLIFTIFVIITGSRIAIVALTLLFLFRMKNQLKYSIREWFFACIFIFLGSAVTLLMIQNTESVFERSMNLFSLKNIDLLSLVWDQTDINQNLIGAESIKQQQYDMSWWIRLHKWVYALKIYLLHPECYLQGVGPGFCGAALDGGYVRLLTENGVVGCLLFWKLFSQLYRQSIQLKWILVAFLINMLFFDVYLAYKPMSLLFLISGYTYAFELKRNNVNISVDVVPERLTFKGI